MTSQQKIRVLIVDDETDVRALLKPLFLRSGDITVIGETGNGKEAVEMALALNPDVVLMDIRLLGMDGLTATELIAQQAPLVRTIIVSASAESASLERARRAGAFDYLVKPFSFDELSASIHRAYEQKLSRLETEETLLRIAEIRDRLELYSQDVIKGCLIDQLDCLAAGIAHDLRSPLNIILGILGTIDINANGEKFARYLERIQRRTLYCKWIIDNFLGISFNEKMTLRNISLIGVVSEALEILDSKLPPSTHLSIRVPDDLEVRSDDNLLRLVLINLIENAIEAMPNGGYLDISTQKADPYVHIVVTDTGIGIPPDNEQKLFSIGFTTKPAHCGIGLYVARRFARQLGGEIVYVGSKQSAGSAFRLVIPIQPVFPFQEDPVKLRETLHNLEEQLKAIKARSLSERDRAFPEFQRITSVFASNLYNELNIIEITVKEMQARVNSEALNSALDKIVQSCTYARLLARNIVELGGTSLPQYSLISPIEVIEEVLGLLERKMPPEHYKVEWEIDPTLGEIEADATSLKQVFMNLIRNALEAMPDGGVLRFQLVREGQTAIITISDSGIGIAPENINRLFTIGFTTKPRGYGIGLHSVKTIITKHKGTISVSSRPGKGTTFVIRLPIKQTGEATHE